MALERMTADVVIENRRVYGTTKISEREVAEQAKGEEEERLLPKAQVATIVSAGHNRATREKFRSCTIRTAHTAIDTYIYVQRLLLLMAL